MRRRVVVDASVAVKWVISETFSAEAGRLLDGRPLIAPAHWLAEAVNAVWGYVLRRRIPAAQASEGVVLLLRAPVIISALPDLVPHALAISIAHSMTVYDSLYLALARAEDAPFVTDDRKLMRKLAESGETVADLVWIGDVQ